MPLSLSSAASSALSWIDGINKKSQINFLVTPDNKRIEIQMLTHQQSRGARGLLDWTHADLAGAATLGLSTIKNFESDRRETTKANLKAMRRALEEAGIEFIPAKAGKGVGIRMRQDVK